MTEDRATVVARLSATIARSDTNPYFRRAASLTRGVPTYADVGGILVVTPEGDVVSVDLDEDVIRTEADRKWRLLALAIAARSYPELADLAPRRPSTARTCDLCAGTGSILGLHCGVCSSLGWVTT